MKECQGIWKPDFSFDVLCLARLTTKEPKELAGAAKNMTDAQGGANLKRGANTATKLNQTNDS
jgi:hypothetical protein